MTNNRFEFENSETDERLSQLISSALGPDDQTDAETERLMDAVAADELPDETVSRILDRAGIHSQVRSQEGHVPAKEIRMQEGRESFSAHRFSTSAVVRPKKTPDPFPTSDTPPAISPPVQLVQRASTDQSSSIGFGAAFAVVVSAACLLVACFVQPTSETITGGSAKTIPVAAGISFSSRGLGTGPMVRASVLPSPVWFNSLQKQATQLVASAIPDSKPIEPAKVGDTIQTGRFEKRRLNLPDGSVLYVNAETKLKIESDRRIKVDAGEVFVEVVPTFDEQENENARQHFVVQTATREVKALGTKFAVNANAKDTDVTVTQGIVDVGGSIATAGQTMHLPFQDDGLISIAPRASHSLGWTEDLMRAVAIVPRSENLGGRLLARPEGQPVTVDTQGQDMQLSLRKYHVDVHIQDGFARTTIDQTYFNDTWQRLEGTFYFPLPADASLSRLAMYVGEKLMEGGMQEREQARNVYEEIRHTKRDPALLEWVDGSTFKLRVFPLEARQEKRLVLSYTQRLNSAYGKTHYRFPAGHNMNVVRDWSTKIVVKGGADREWTSSSHDMTATTQANDLMLTAAETASTMGRDLVVELNDEWTVNKQSGRKSIERTRLSRTVHEDHQYLMVRHRPKLQVGRIKTTVADPAANTGEKQLKEQTDAASAQRAGSAPVGLIRPTRDWIILFESSGDRDPVLARTQIEVIRTFLENAEHTDRFAIVSAGSKARFWKDDAVECTAKNVAEAIAALEDTQLIGALDLESALQQCTQLTDNDSDNEKILVHVGSGLPVLGVTEENELVKQLPREIRYVGLGIGKRWSRQFMKQAASKTGGYFTQINPDEKVAWRAFEAFSILNAPRLLNINVADKANKQRFRTWTESIADGEEVCAITRLGKNDSLPKSIVIKGEANGQSWKVNIPVAEDLIADQADYLPRSWAKLEIDRLVAEGAATNKQTIVDLSKAMYVMSPFTSLLVLEDEAMYAKYKVDRGRKDHWALYPCPDTIKVVYEPGAPTRQQAGKPVSTELPSGPLSFEQAVSSVVNRARPHWGSPQHFQELVATYESLLAAKKYNEALSYGRFAKKLQPENPIAETMVWKAQFAREHARIMDLKGSKEQGILDVLYDVDVNMASIPFDGEIEYPKNWDELTRRRRGYQDGGVLFGNRGVEATLSDFDNNSDGVPDSVWVDLNSNGALDSWYGWTGTRVRVDSVFSRTDRQVYGEPKEIILAGADGEFPFVPNGDLNKFLFNGRAGFQAQREFDFNKDFGLAPDINGLVLLSDGSQRSTWTFEFIPRHVVNVPQLRRYGTPNTQTYTVQIPATERGLRTVTRTVMEAQSQAYTLEIPMTEQRLRQIVMDSNGDEYTVNIPSSVQFGAYRPRVLSEKESLINESLLGMPLPPRLVGYWKDSGSHAASTGFQLSQLDQELLRRRDDLLLRYQNFTASSSPGRYRQLSQLSSTLLPWQAPGGLNREVFGDLVSYAPGMHVSRIDLLSVLEAETKQPKPQRGTVDPAARRLIEAARTGGWENVTMSGRHGLSILLDRKGRYTWDRKLPVGLRESVVCDGDTLWHLYNEIGLGSKRANGRLHQASLRRMIPWLVADIDQLAAGSNVSLKGKHTVVITPIHSDDKTSKSKTQDGESVIQKVGSIHLVFDDEYRLIKRQLIVDGKVIAKQTYDAAGNVKTIDADGKVVAEYQLKRSKATATAFNKVAGTLRVPTPKAAFRTGEDGVDSKTSRNPKGPASAGGTRSVPATLIVPMPYRSVAAVKRSHKDVSKPMKEWDEETALAMLGAYIGESKAAEAAKLLQERFFARGDKRIGLTVLLATRSPQSMYNGKATNKAGVDLRPDAEDSPLAQFMRQYMTWNVTGDDNREFAIDGNENGFVQRMATARNLYYRWKNGLATKDRTTNQIKAELESALKFIASCDNAMGWQLIRVIQPTVTAPKLNELLAEAAQKFTDSPQLEWLAKSARIRALFVAGKYGKARQEYRDLMFVSLKAGQTPIIETDLQQKFRERGNGPHLWRRLVSDMQEYAIEHRLLRTAVNLSIRLRQLKFEDQADTMLSAALNELDVEARPDVATLAIGHLRGLDRFAEADKLMSPLLELPYLQYDARVWRYASDISDQRGQKKDALERLERALAMEFQFRPAVIDLQKLRTDYGNLLSKYEAVIDASKTLGQDPPEDLTARIIAASDRWRMLDDNNTPSCQAAAKLLAKLNDRERAWDYLTTPLATNPGDSQTWVVMARHLRGDGDFDRAHTAFAKAFSFEKTNPDILLEHARSLRKYGETTEAKRLFEQISRSDWQPRFANTKKEAQRVLTEL